MAKIEPSASSAYFRSVAGGRKFSHSDMTPEFVREAEILREEVRRAEGGGGMCHVMSEIMENRHGWPRLSVAYLSPDGDVICAAHVVSLLPDGSIIDWTRDQFGDGHSISFVGAHSPEIGRYRPEFYEDFHPGHPEDETGQLSAWLDSYAGAADYDEQDRLRVEKGRGWWLDDLTSFDEFEARQLGYARGEQSAFSSRL
ncbi:hypothetical protein HFO56_00590 [Rhizobium laguerreae]|uniref:hypothetical protein n=1 Tax=Rhizobium laguerreae TaxID=1076926 RepID=UPI001C90421A|nr:hypothetical protein [Rhizobium laguerreae]MBY3150926.1 hypothetical protein [Rhizobium laguerreae]